MTNHMGFTSQLKVYLGMYLQKKQEQDSVQQLGCIPSHSSIKLKKMINIYKFKISNK